MWTRLVADLGWVDISALTVLALFFLLGICKGMVWQIGRAVAWCGSYGLSAALGPDVAEHVFAGAPPAAPQLYLAYVVVFLLAYVLLSGAGHLVCAMVRRAGLGAFDRLAGGVLGVGTGSAVVLGLLTVVLMFGQRFPVYAAVQDSKVIGFGRAALDVLGAAVPESLQAAFVPPPPARAVTHPLRADTPTLDGLLRDAERRR